jgi:hypothetical protein
MGVLDQVLAYKAQQQAQQMADISQVSSAVQLFNQARQQAQENQLRSLLVNSQVKNLDSEVLQRAQQTQALQRQNDLISGYMNGGGSGLNLKSLKVGDATFEASPNQAPAISSIDQIPNPSDKAIVKGILDYSIDPSKSTSIRNNRRETLIGMASQIDPTYDQKQFPARQAFQNSIKSGPLSKQIISANTLIGHLDSLQKSFDELNKARPSNQYPLVNRVENALNKGAGKGEVTAVDNNITAVTNELETLFRGSGQGSERGIQEWRKSISDAASPEQQKAAIGKALELMASRLNAIDEQHQNVMGKPRDFSVLNDKSRKALTKLGIDPTTIDQAVQPQGSDNQPSMEDLQHTAKLHNMTVDQVKKRLGIK